jgi:opacity protein-like surface antigen
MFSVQYDLASREDIELYVSIDGTRFVGPMQHVSGAVGKGLAPERDKMILWNIGEELGQVNQSNLMIRVVTAEEGKRLTSAQTQNNLNRNEARIGGTPSNPSVVAAETQRNNVPAITNTTNVPTATNEPARVQQQGNADLIVKTNGEEIRVRVEEVGHTEIRYKRFGNETGPTFTIRKSDVFMITYADGTRDVFERSRTGTSSPNRSAATNSHQGDKAFGGNLLLGTGGSYTHFGIGVKYSYNITAPIRMTGEFDFFPKNDDASFWDFSIYGHYLFSVGEKSMLYPLVGLGGTGVNVEVYNGIKSVNGFAFTLGGGFEIELSSNWMLNLELRLKFIDFNSIGLSGNRTNFVAGLVYRF